MTTDAAREGLDLGDNLLGADEPASVAMLLRYRLCTAQCLCAAEAEDGSCGCPCEGSFHGVLSRVLVPGSVRRPRRDDADGGGAELALFAAPQVPEPDPDKDLAVAG